MARRTTPAPVSPVTTGDQSALIEVEAPAIPTLAETLAECQSTESTLATLTLAIHQSWAAFDKASTAYDKARVSMVKAGVIPARIAAQLYSYAVTDKAFHAARGINAGKPAVEKLATHLGYERRRFEPILKAGLALLEAKVTLAPEDDVTPEDLEIVAPHLSKDAARQAKKAAEKKANTAGTPAVPPADQDGDDTTPPAPPAADSPVILADVMRSLEATAKLAESFATTGGLTREAMDSLQDVLSHISETLESVVADK